MSRTNTYQFDDSNNYTHDSDYIEFVNGRAQLKLIDLPDQDFNEDFADDTDFTYDSDKSEFAGGLVRQKDQVPTNAICGANYDSDVNLEDWSGGVVTGNATGGASVAGGRLDLTGGSVKYVNYDADGNTDSQQIGAVRFSLTPNYSGNPGGDRSVFFVRASGPNDNLIFLRHRSSGKIQVLVYDENSSIIINTDLGVWNPTSGVSYEWELDWDITSGETRLFIDGVQFGATQTGTGIRSVDIAELRLGSNVIGTDESDFYIDSFLFFGTVQHTSNYTPGYTVPEYKYLADTLTLPEMEWTGQGTLISFDDFDVTDSNSPRYTLQIGRSGNYLYWDGAQWATSDGTWAQSTDKATFLANVASLDVNGEVYVQFKLHFNDGGSQMSCSDLTATLTAQTYLNGDTNICVADTISATEVTAVSLTGSSNVRVAFGRLNGTDHVYWDGSAWVASDCSYDQANDVADLTEAVLAELLSSGDQIKWGVVIQGDGDTQEYIDTFSISYNYYTGDISPPDRVLVHGTEYDPEGNPLQGVSITAKLTLPASHSEESGIHQIEVSATSDSNGYWSMNLVENADLSPSGTKYLSTKTYSSEIIEKRHLTVDADGGSTVSYFELS